MQLVQAINQQDWSEASQMLLSTIDKLNSMGHPLWTPEQVSQQTLSNTYMLEHLHFLIDNAERIGLVFLLQSDPGFWPEITTHDSLYFHKLALVPSCMSQGNGSIAIRAIIQEAKKRSCRWVRLDCDDRPALHRFYQNCGFELVDVKRVEEFRVARYRLSIKK